ncbi:hypothetical protein [Streptomyces mirabilis]|uniref:hypothetical protein n=1 Tax=Streptomyces mirabilis TaxID=68239 RepID=UPI0033F9CBBA
MNPKRHQRTLRIMLAVAVGAALAIAVTASIMKDPRHGEGLLGEVLVSGDGRTITTLNSRAPCQQDSPELVVSESRDSVTLVLKEAIPISGLSATVSTSRSPRLCSHRWGHDGW